MTVKTLLGVGSAALLLALPLLGVDDYYLHLLIMAGIFFLLSAGMNLLLAAGQLNLGHTAFFGIGAYASGLLALHFGLSPAFALPAAALVSAVVGWLLGMVTLRLRGAYFVLVTVGFAEVIRLVATNWMELTQGPMGLAGVPPFNLGTERFTLTGKRDFYYFMLFLAGATLWVTARLLRSRVGRALRAVRENESLAESSGISAYRHTMLAMVVSCLLAGAAGGFYAHYITFLSPELFGFQNTVTMAVMVVAGGQGTVLGPAVGALVFTFVPELLRMAAFYRMLLYGAILLLVVMFMPKGLVFYLRRLLPAGAPAVAEPAPDSAVFEAGAAAPAPGPALSVRDVTVRFGGLAAVEGLSLDLGRGEILALIGPNGAGKSTAFNVVTGFQAPDAGRVRFGDGDITAEPPYRIAERGLVRMFQRTSLFPEAAVLENVLTACHRLARTGLGDVLLMTRSHRLEEHRLEERARALLAFVGLGHKGDEPARSLSCGEQRLLGLAIALAPAPSVLLLDEPAAGLNAVETERLMRLIEEIRARGLSVLLVEHDMKLVMGMCDRVVVLNYGVKIAEGTPAEIQRHAEVIRAYLDLETLLLVLDAISAGYGPVEVLHGVSLRVAEGELVCLLGANGAGKSTTVRTISGLLRPKAGTITFLGERLDGRAAHAVLKRGIAQCPEGRRIFPEMTVQENLEMGAYVRGHAGAGPGELERVFHHFPRLKERARQLGGTLSGGEQQMLAIARALMSAPRLLLLDEPSLGLAPTMVETVFRVIAEIRREGMTVLMVEQNAALALRMADRAYVMESGRIALEGAARDLLDNPEVRRAYLGG